MKLVLAPSKRPRNLGFELGQLVGARYLQVHAHRSVRQALDRGSARSPSAAAKPSSRLDQERTWIEHRMVICVSSPLGPVTRYAVKSFAAGACDASSSFGATEVSPKLH